MTNLTPSASPAESGLLRGVLLVALLFWIALLTSLHAETVRRVDQDAFVEAIKRISIEEHQRAGVPASITAAQAILESNWGRAPIAVAGNNYFGIKCKSSWTGESVMQEDDDYNAAGQLIESCFRAYNSVEESFRDHSDFLLGSDRYAELFKLAPTDYRAWARGLKACGYATDPAYADKLIAIIERLELYTLDWPSQDEAEWLMTNSEDARGTADQRTWTDIPDTFAPSGQGDEITVRVN